MTERPEDPDAYLAFLRRYGPSTYGAASTALAWGGTRAARAEAALIAQGRVKLNAMGKACPIDNPDETPSKGTAP